MMDGLCFVPTFCVIILLFTVCQSHWMEL
uniref:Uncharacterized protein n=1 Tax=Rhizophora mucronata TaxID=61149 RepID=A0A2P2QCV6_RHIMU